MSAWVSWGRVLACTLLVVLTLTVAAVFAVLRAGFGVYIVHTGSMEPTYRSGTLVVERHGLAYGRGDVITFEHGAGPGDLVTHRVVRITRTGITTKGDGNPTSDLWTIRPDQVHGRVVGQLPRMGYLAYFLKQPAGVGSVMTGALSVLLLWSLFFPPARPEDAPETGDDGVEVDEPDDTEQAEDVRQTS